MGEHAGAYRDNETLRNFGKVIPNSTILEAL